MDKERQEELEWFVQFANMNLNELGPGDKAKFLVESEEHLFPTKEIKKFYSRIPTYVRPERFVDFTGKMLWVFKKQPLKDSEDFWTNILRLQNEVIKTLKSFTGIHSLSIRGKITGRGEIYYSLNWNREKFHLSLLPLTDSHEDYIRLKIYGLLDSLSRSTIQKCPGCEKYFLNPTLRKKRFCSPKCMWRVNAEKRREGLKKNPKEYKTYLKKQRELMRRRYEEKRKEG